MSLKRVKCKHVSKSVWRDSGLPGSSIVLATRGLGICKQPLLLLEMRSMRSVHSWILMICHRCRIPGTWKYLPTKLMLDTCMILLNTCKISSCGLLTIKALSEKDELHDMMSNKTLVEEHQISGASELLTLGFLSPTSSEGKNCKKSRSSFSTCWMSLVRRHHLRQLHCFQGLREKLLPLQAPTNVYGRSWRLSVVPKVESFSSFPMSLSSCSSACILKKRKKKHHKLNTKLKSLRKHPLKTCKSVSKASWLLDQAAKQGTESLEYR